MTDVLENPALLVGVPLVALGAIGLAVLLGVVFTQWLHPS